MKKKRSVLFCIHSLVGGGAEKMLIDLLRQIDTNLFDVDLCLLYRRGVYFDSIPDYVNYFIYSEPRTSPPKKYDVEVAFLEGTPTKLVALHNSAAVKIAWVHTDMYSYRLSANAYKSHDEEALCYNMLDHIVFVSQTARQQFEKLFPYVNTNKTVIYNLINKAEISAKSHAYSCPAEKNKLTMCSIGRLDPVKGFDRLIPILSRLKNDRLDFHHWILGDGSQKNEIQNLIEQHDLKDTVFLMGFQKNPFPYLKASDIFVSPSHLEGLPLAVGEAICLGKPIVATNVSGTAEILGNGEYGMLAKSNEDAIYQRLKEMLCSETLRKDYAQKAKTGSTTDIFNLQKNIDLVNELLYNASSKKTLLRKITPYLSNKKHGLEIESILEKIDQRVHLTIADQTDGIYLAELGNYLLLRVKNTTSEDNKLSTLENKKFLIHIVDLFEQFYSHQSEDSMTCFCRFLTELDRINIFPDKVKRLIREINSTSGNYHAATNCSIPVEATNKHKMNRLSYVSFVIPAKIDSPERSRNLDLLIAFLLQHFDSPIIVLEADKTRRYFPKSSCKQLQYLFVKDLQQGFYHTKYLNRLYRMVNTPVTAIWDTDIIAASHQIIESAEQIRQGKAVMGLPYDGSAYFTTAELTTGYQQTMNFDTLESQKKYLRKMNGRLAVGGAILVDTEKYYQAGVDNEFFTDWGPEDLERVKRIEIMYQKPVYRYPGYLYHLWHPRHNSQYNDPQKEIMFKQEYLKICSMTLQELKKYVATWQWAMYNDYS